MINGRDLGVRIPNDVNVYLQRIQKSSFSSISGTLFSLLAERYFCAIKIVGIETALYDDLIQVRKKIDLTSMEPFWPLYEHIAAYYRLHIDDHGQLPIPFSNEPSYFDQLKTRWFEYIQQQIEVFLNDERLIRLLLLVFVNSDDEAGKNALSELSARFNQDYPLMVKRKIYPES